MFLTQFDINVARRDAMRLLASPERLHAAVLSAFPPGQSTSDDTRTLWRLDRGPAKHDARLMIVSPLQPDLTTLNEQAGWSTGVPGRSADYDPFLRGLQPGSTWQFRCTVNPTTAIRTASGSRGKRVAEVTAEQQLAWFIGRAERHGFAVPVKDQARVTRREVLRFRRQGSTVTLAVAQVDGVIQIQDADAAREALVHGIGPAKGYGCGLMTLAPMTK
ncbi:type I-E CRISPR-associated protein Cas6/Cse3/CasE [Cutibacterium avidum]|jgi:CRISPR system CASCADE complex protein casE|uniref:CRISPR-associated Cse3 family protein n=1 Tax=Cutibacterium granulosum DSM 20700 TaxID=1160719 RepID=U1FGK8_9ACTN|nr:type I-E CRISPR-associated protein Cas6/Cse3/CasE [Cutibacterium granulosum]ERF58411.1 CRISPR-associated Cse3 family protein [Cutibacterium granulosum DSM 20700]MEA5644849.1 type I-E CRISPR-associated protein Cas6/Cse3/CasE [Cutibacterium granulosum]